MKLSTTAGIRRGAIQVALAALLALVAAVTLAAAPGKAGHALTSAGWHPCNDVVVQFKPEGSGGGTEVRAKRIGCKKARKTIRKCIKGELRPGWAGKYLDPKFKLKKGDKRIEYLPVGGGGCIPVSRAAGPHPPAEADRVETFKLNLDKDRAKERIFVYNLSQGKPPYDSPVSWFEVWNKKAGGWAQVQRKLVYENPGSSDAGLVSAWVSDLNRDGHVEIAVRDFVSPSFGEILSIYRQKSKHSTRFRKLQIVGGDQVKMKPRKKKTALLKAYLMSNHSPDNLEHHEVWKWSGRANQWTCRKDCAARSGGGAGS